MESNLESRDLWDNVMASVPDTNLSVGPYFGHQLMHNPKHVLFTFSRYKFVEKMVGSGKNILELGCNEGLASLIIAERANSYMGIDFDERAIKWAKKNILKENMKFKCDDFLGKKYGEFDVVVSLDVVEHIYKEQDDEVLATIYDNLHKDGFCIIGTPNKVASFYATKASEIGHVNLYDEKRLRKLLEKKFNNVFIFSCNDEMVHTGFYNMAHYLIAIACFKKE